MPLKEGDIVVYIGTELENVCGDIFFYVDNPESFGDENNMEEASVVQISDWHSWALGLKKSELRVVGHVEPLKLNYGPDILREGNFLPTSSKPLLAQWLGRRRAS